MATLLPDSHIVRAFSHIQDEMLVSRAMRQPGLWAVAIAGNNSESVSLIADLSSSVGYVPVITGRLEDSQPLDPGGVLFPHMFLPNDMRDALAWAGGAADGANRQAEGSADGH